MMFSNFIVEIPISIGSFVFRQSFVSIPNLPDLTNRSGLAVAPFGLVYYSLSVTSFVFVVSIGGSWSKSCDGFVSFMDIVRS